jgi:hypothetical protein
MLPKYVYIVILYFQRCGSSMLQSSNPATVNYSSVNQQELYSMWRHAVRIRHVGTPRRYHEECSATTPQRHLQPHHHHHHHHLSSSLNRTPEALIGLSRCSKLWNRWTEHTWSFWFTRFLFIFNKHLTP